MGVQILQCVYTYNCSNTIIVLSTRVVHTRFMLNMTPHCTPIAMTLTHARYVFEYSVYL